MNSIPSKSKHPGGRPSKLTPALADQAVALAASLAPESTICEALRIEQDTFINWKHRAREGSKLHKEFFGRFRQARALAKIARLKALQDTGEWRASAWLLERSDPAHFGRQVIEHTGPHGTALPIHDSPPPITIILQGAEGLENPYEPPALTRG